MHRLLAWLRREHGDAPPEGRPSDVEIEDELEPVADGYEGTDS